VKGLVSIFFCFALILPFAANAKTAEEFLSDSRGLAQKNNLIGARRLLDEGIKQYPVDEELKLQRARVLVWQGKYAEASKELDTLNKNNLDVVLVQANLALNQGRLVEAEAKYRAILLKSPNYVEAKEGLKRTMNAKTSPESFYWRLDATFIHGEYTRVNFPNHYEGGAQLTRFFDDRALAVYGGYNLVRKYRKTDSEYKIGASQKFSSWFVGSAFVVASPDPKFRPRWQLDVGADTRLAEKRDFAPFWLLGTAHEDRYPTKAVDTFKAGVRIEPLDAFAFQARGIWVAEQGRHPVFGFDTRLDVQIMSDLSVNFGFSDAGETEQNMTARTRAFFTGASMNLSPQMAVRFGYEHENRQGSYLRNGVNANVSYSF